MIFGERVPGSEDFKSKILEFFGDFGLPGLPLLNSVSFDGLVGPGVSGFFGYFLFEVLEGSPDLIALGLFFVEFILEFE